MTRDNASHEEPQLDDVVRRAKAGDGSAWQRLDHEMRTPFAWVAERRLGGQLGARADRSDMVQEAFLAAWKKMAEFRGDTFAQFCCWYDRILENKCREHIRRHHEKCRDMELETPLPEGSHDTGQPTYEQVRDPHDVGQETGSDAATAAKGLADQGAGAITPLPRLLSGMHHDEVVRVQGHGPADRAHTPNKQAVPQPAHFTRLPSRPSATL